MAKQTSRGARLTALALATGTLVVAATSPAGAAPVSVPDVFGGEATGTAIHIEINLPVPVTVPQLGTITQLKQTISFSTGNLEKSLTAKPVSVAKATLGDGTIVVVSDLLRKQVVASLDGQQSASDALLQDVNLGLIKASIGKINSSVSPESATTTLTSQSTSSLANLSVGLGSLADDLPIKAELDTLTQTLEDTVGEGGLLSETVDTALQTIDQATQGATGPVTEQVQAVKNEIVSLLDQLSTTIGDLTSDTDLVRLALLESTEKVTRVGDTVTATATSTVGGLNVLNGLVVVDAAKTTSTSSANGVKGAAAATSSTDVAHVKVADVLELTLGPAGLTGKVLGQDIPQQVKDAFQTVLGAVNQVLALAGVQIINGAVTSEVDPNGQFASSDSTGLMIIVNPLKATNPLIKIQLVPAGTAVRAARFAPRNNPPQNNNPPTVRNPGGQPPLAHTGAELPMFAMLGTGLAGLALVLRRRRRIFEV